MISKLLRNLPALLVLCLAAAHADAQERDTLILYNGQTLIGDIKGAQLGVMSIDDVDIKVIHVKMYKIKAVNSSGKFRIETNDRRIFFGRLKRSVKPGWVNIMADDSSVITIPVEKLSIVIALENKFFARLDGNFGAGFSYTKSSAAGQTNISLSAQYTSRKFEYQLNVSLNGSIDSTGYDRDREDISLFTAYFLTSSWFVAGSFEYQRNLELSLARRYQQMVGGGSKIFVRQNWKFLAGSGLTFSQEKSTAGESSGLLLEIPILMRFNFFKFHQPNLQISSSQTFFYGITQKNRIRFSGSTSFSWELIKDFNLDISPYTNYDSQPPEGNSNIDYGIVINISYKF